MSPSIASSVQHSSDDRCCVCKQLGAQIHHIDGKPSNNALSNLAFLCLQCHDRASKRSTLSRGLSAATIRRFRDEWHAMVVSGKQLRAPRVTISNQSAIILHALQAHEIRKIGFRIGTPTSSATRAALDELLPYSLQWDATPLIRHSIIEAVSHCSCIARSGMTSEVAQTIRQLASNAMLVGHTVGQRRHPVTRQERDVLLAGATIGLNLAYDGALYLRSIRVVDCGGWILWTGLRLALANRLKDVERTAREHFATARSAARRSSARPFEEAERWLEWLELDAGVFENDRLVPPPKDVEALINNPDR